MSDELFELPDSWKWATTSEVCASVRDGTHDSPKYVDDGIPLVTSKNLRNGQIDFSTAKLISKEDHQQISVRSGVEPGDVLFAMIGTIGNPVVVNEDKEFSIKNVGLFKKNSSAIDSQYLKHWLSSDPFFKIIEQQDLIKGTTQKFLPLGNLRTLSLPLPPLNEQKRIVAKIEELRDRLHRSKQALEAIPELCDRFRQSVLAAAFRGDLTADWREENLDVEAASVLAGEADNNLPATWCLSSIGDVIESLKYGTSKKSDYEVEGVPVLRIPNIGDGYIRLDDLKYADLPQKEIEELKLIPGDILLIRSNGSVSLVGKSAVVRETEAGFVYAGYLIRLRLDPLLIDSEYLSLCLSSRDLRLQIEVPARSTSGVHNINSQEVKKLKIPLPPIKEQKEIIRNVEFLFKTIDSLMQQYTGSSIQLDRLNQSILAKAFRGELVEQDPNDEPASVLLDRIRAERQAQEGKKSGGAKGKRKKASSDQLDLPGME